MSNKTLYEIYKDVCECKEVDKEDLKLALLTYRSLLWFANHDVEELYKNTDKNVFVKARFETNVMRYKKALDAIPKKWLGKENIPGTQAYKEKDKIFNGILQEYEKWKGGQENE